MTNRFMVHPLKLAVSLATALFSAAMALCLAGLGRWGASLLFLAVAALFLSVSLVFGAFITVDAGGVRRSVLGKVSRELPWDRIAEVGVAGSKIFNRNNPKKTGSLYIYFSPVPMTEEQRFDMMLNGPPREQLFFLYTEQRINAVQLLWSGEIQTYNSGDLHF